MKTITILALSLLAVVPAADAKRLSKAETQELLERARERLSPSAEPAAPFVVQAKLVLPFDENAPPGLYQYSSADSHRWRRDVSLPGWREARGHDGEKAWTWAHEQNREELRRLARWAEQALEPGGLMSAPHGRRARLREIGDEPIWELEGAGGATLRLLPDSGLPHSWSSAASGYRFEGWTEAGGRAWPERVTVLSRGTPVLVAELVAPRAGTLEPPPPGHFAPPEGARFRAREGDPDLTPPRLLSAPIPHYPEELRRRQVTGTVIIRCVIDVDGRTRELELLVDPHPELSKAALESVAGRRYAPGRLNDEPVEVISTIRVAFTLN